MILYVILGYGDQKMLRNVEKKVAIGAEMLRMVFPSKNQIEIHHHVSSCVSHVLDMC